MTFPDRAALEAHQLGRLQRLRQVLIPGNPFYAPRLAAEFSSLAEFSARIPFTYKKDFIADQQAHPPYGSNLTYPLGAYTRFCQTSSTTGSPLRWLDTPATWNWMAGCWTRVFEASGVEPGARVFFAFSFGPFLGFWTAFDAAIQMGCLAIPGGGMNSTARLRALLDSQAQVLCCTPTYAVRLAEVAAAEQIDLAGAAVRRIIVAGEPGGSVPATRALIERLWPGARVFDHHGMTETGPVTYECPKRAGVLHVIEAEYFAEIVDPHSGAAVPVGERGELALTNFGREGSPVIRYRTGDIVQPSAAARCECASVELALEGGILARRDDMVIIRGVNVYPSAVEDAIRSCGGVAEYRVEVATVRSMIELQLDVEPDAAALAADPDGSHLAHRLECALRDALGLRIPTRIVASGTLPRFEMKAKRWVRIH